MKKIKRLIAWSLRKLAFLFLVVALYYTIETISNVDKADSAEVLAKFSSSEAWINNVTQRMEAYEVALVKADTEVASLKKQLLSVDDRIRRVDSQVSTLSKESAQSTASQADSKIETRVLRVEELAKNLNNNFQALEAEYYQGLQHYESEKVSSKQKKRPTEEVKNRPE